MKRQKGVMSCRAFKKFRKLMEKKGFELMPEFSDKAGLRFESSYVKTISSGFYKDWRICVLVGGKGNQATYALGPDMKRVGLVFNTRLSTIKSFLNKYDPAASPVPRKPLLAAELDLAVVGDPGGDMYKLGQVMKETEKQMWNGPVWNPHGGWLEAIPGTDFARHTNQMNAAGPVRHETYVEFTDGTKGWVDNSHIVTPVHQCIQPCFTCGRFAHECKCLVQLQGTNNIIIP